MAFLSQEQRTPQKSLRSIKYLRQLETRMVLRLFRFASGASETFLSTLPHIAGIPRLMYLYCIYKYFYINKYITEALRQDMALTPVDKGFTGASRCQINPEAIRFLLRRLRQDYIGITTGAVYD